MNSDISRGSSALKETVCQNALDVKNGHVNEFDADSSWLYTRTMANVQIIDNVLESLIQ